MSKPRLPDFLIIGAQKSGTTWLAKQLQAHSDVFMPDEEIHFFDHPDRFAKGPDWYAEQFVNGAAGQLIGEKTPEYLYLPDRVDIPEGARRIHSLLPDARLIAIFRDPVTRALSAINHMVNRHHISPLHSVDALLLGRKRHVLPWPVIEMGMYERQLAPFLKLYGQQAVLTMFYEDEVVAEPEGGLSTLFDFLGIRREIHGQHVRRHPHRERRSRLGLAVDHYVPALTRWTGRHDWRLPQYYPRLSKEAEQELYALYEPSNERLFDLLGKRPSSGWYSAPE